MSTKHAIYTVYQYINILTGYPETERIFSKTPPKKGCAKMQLTSNPSTHKDPYPSWGQLMALISLKQSSHIKDWMLQSFGYSNKSNIFLCFQSSASISTAIWVQSTTIIILVVYSLTWTDKPEKITTRQHPLKSKQWRWQSSLIYKRAMSWSLATKLHAMNDASHPHHDRA